MNAWRGGGVRPAGGGMVGIMTETQVRSEIRYHGYPARMIGQVLGHGTSSRKRVYMLDRGAGLVTIAVECPDQCCRGLGPLGVTTVPMDRVTVHVVTD